MSSSLQRDLHRMVPSAHVSVALSEAVWSRGREREREREKERERERERERTSILASS